MATRPAIFKWRQTEPVFIFCAIRWYLRYSLSPRDVEELLAERGLEADHTTVWRWVQRYGPELEQSLRRHLKPTNKSWRVGETYIRVKGRWCYLYRAIRHKEGRDSPQPVTPPPGPVSDQHHLARPSCRSNGRVNAKQGFRESQAAQRAIQGYEAMNIIRKGPSAMAEREGVCGVRIGSSTTSSK
jgi:IS6 family transposase